MSFFNLAKNLQKFFLKNFNFIPVAVLYQELLSTYRHEFLQIPFIKYIKKWFLLSTYRHVKMWYFQTFGIQFLTRMVFLAIEALALGKFVGSSPSSCVCSWASKMHLQFGSRRRFHRTISVLVLSRNGTAWWSWFAKCHEINATCGRFRARFDFHQPLLLSPLQGMW